MTNPNLAAEWTAWVVRNPAGLYLRAGVGIGSAGPAQPAAGLTDDPMKANQFARRIDAETFLGFVRALCGPSVVRFDLEAVPERFRLIHDPEAPPADLERETGVPIPFDLAEGIDDLLEHIFGKGFTP